MKANKGNKDKGERTRDNAIGDDNEISNAVFRYGNGWDHGEGYHKDEDGASKGVGDEQQEVLVVAVSHAIIHPRAMVIHFQIAP